MNVCYILISTDKIGGWDLLSKIQYSTRTKKYGFDRIAGASIGHQNFVLYSNRWDFPIML